MLIAASSNAAVSADKKSLTDRLWQCKHTQHGQPALTPAKSAWVEPHFRGLSGISKKASGGSIREAFASLLLTML